MKRKGARALDLSAGGPPERRLFLAALFTVVLPLFALVAVTGWREVGAERAASLARALDASEARARATLAALSDEMAARAISATARALDAAGDDPALLAGVRSGAIAAVLVDATGSVRAPSLIESRPAPLAHETEAAISSARDLALRFGDPSSATRSLARLLDGPLEPAAESRVLFELAGLDAREGDWPAAAAICERAIAIEDAAGGPLLGASERLQLSLIGVEALGRADGRDRARTAACRLARELELASAAGTFADGGFARRRIEELIGESPVSATALRLDRAAGFALRRGELAGALARARSSLEGIAILHVPPGVGDSSGAPELLALRVSGDRSAAPALMVDAGLDGGLRATTASLAGRGIRVRLRDPGGAPVLGAGAESDAPCSRAILVSLRGMLAGFSAEVDIRPAPLEATALAREALILEGALAAAALAIAAATVFVVRGAARAIELERARSDFTAGVTHDLKTPLSLIRMYAETLRLGREADAEERARFLDVILGEADRLHGLVENVLSLKHRGGALDRGERDIAASVRTAAQGFAPSGGRAIGVELAVEEDLPDVPHDRMAVERIVRNLLSNAARFAPEGSAVRVELARERGGVRIAVRDRGPGIPETIASRVFEPFFSSGPGKGTGLGLAVVRALARAHGGDARLRRDRPGCAVVEVWLPGEGARP